MLIVKDEQVTIRLVGDRKAFTIEQRIAIKYPVDRTANMGIRILRSMAKKIDNYSALEMNCMIMRI